MSLPINNGKHLEHVVNTTVCGQHKAGKHVACWSINSGSPTGPDQLLAVCGRRIRKAGYNGKISSTALQLKRQQNSPTYKKEVRA